MARQVTGTTSSFLSLLTTESIPYPLTISFRAKLKTTTANGICFTYGEAYPDWDAEYGGASLSGYSATSGKGATFSGTAAVPASVPPDQWHLIVAVYASATDRRLYFNSSAITAVDTVAVPAGTHAARNFTLGGVLITPGAIYSPASYGFDAEFADAAIWNTGFTAADVDALALGRPGIVKPANLKGWWKLGSDGSLASSAGTYPAMTVYGTCPVTPDPAYLGDPISVPPHYKPNEELSWVTKATHIWALHPSNPLKADKGGMTLEPVTGTAPVPAPYADNTMEFFGGDTGTGSGNTASYYQTIASLIWGDDPAVAGNQTPPAIGSLSCWVYFYSFPPSGVPGILGQRSNYAGATAATVEMSVAFSGLTVFDVNGFSHSGSAVALNQWHHLAGTNDGTSRKFYLNGVLKATNAQTSVAMFSEPMQFGATNTNAGQFPPHLRLRLVASANGAVWTDAEILEQYQRPYAYYKPDPTHVPDTYFPNTDLSWVQKATHIWAVHPADPLKADKGGMTLTPITGTNPAPVALASPENTMKFSGGSATTAAGVASYYTTIGSLIWGDDPATAGNNTPPNIGSISCWIYIDGTPAANYAYPVGQTTAGQSILFGHRTDNRIIFSLGTFNTGPILIAGQWNHICGTHDASLRRLYVNGVKVTEGVVAVAAGLNDPISIGGAPRTSGTPYGFNGRIRLVASVSGAVWTEAEILEQYNRPYAYYASEAPVAPVVGIVAGLGAFALAGAPAILKATRRLTALQGTFTETGLPASLRADRLLRPGVGVFELVKVPGVPDTYTPNTALSWAQKATHIWAVHPSDPLKADKGGTTLEVRTVGAGVPPSVHAADNTMEFHGGHETNASWYRSPGTFIWGDDPVTAGNQTPPMIGAMSCWVYINAHSPTISGICGGAGTSSSGLTLQESAHLAAHFGAGAGQSYFQGSAGSTASSFSDYGDADPGVWNHIAITNDASYRRLYINGVKFDEQANNSGAGVSLPFNIGHTTFASAANRYTLNGRIRLVALVQGATWTDAEILEQYQQPYAYYAGDQVAQAGIAILTVGRKLIGGTGVFALDGYPISTAVTRYLRAGHGVFIMTGHDAEMKQWLPLRGSGRIFYVAKDDRIVYIPADTIIRE